MNMMVVKLSKKFERLSIQVRLMVTVLCVVSFYLFWNSVVDQMLVKSRDDSILKTKSLKEKAEEITKKISEASEVVKSNPNLELSKRVEDAKKASVLLDQAIHDKTIKMVSPQDMNRILEYMVQQAEGLTLVKMDSLPVKALLQKTKNNENPEKTNMNIFEHGLSMELLGGYFETLDFLKELEKRRLNVVWDEISYEVQKYPVASVKILMHTLSLDEGWIGV
jgi:MSHA biogenesis protein MshJ